MIISPRPVPQPHQDLVEEETQAPLIGDIYGSLGSTSGKIPFYGLDNISLDDIDSPISLVVDVPANYVEGITPVSKLQKFGPWGRLGHTSSLQHLKSSYIYTLHVVPWFSIFNLIVFSF